MHGLLTDPVNLPYTLLLRTLLFMDAHSAVLVRLASVVCGLAVVGAFYWVVQHWHGHRVAFISTLLFGLSTRFLFVARLGEPEVLLFGLFGLFALGVWLRSHAKSRFALPVALLVAASLLYVPGMVWFIAAGVAWQWKTIVQKLIRTPAWATIVAGVAVIGILFPLIWSIVKQPHLLQTLAAIPAHVPHVRTLLHNLLDVPLQLFYAGNTLASASGINGLLVLDSFAIVMFLLGTYLYIRYIHLRRSWLLWIMCAVALALISLGGVAVTVLLPFAYLVVSAGVAFLLGQWLEVFPRNVFARSVGIVLLCAIIALACVYNTRRYFVAWPNSTQAKSIFTQKAP